jgi:hypothetical protein
VTSTIWGVEKAVSATEIRRMAFAEIVGRERRKRRSLEVRIRRVNVAMWLDYDKSFERFGGMDRSCHF